MKEGRRWVRDGKTYKSTAYPGWKILDTERKGKRDRYVIVRPDGTQDRDWHRAHLHKKLPGLNEAMWSAEARARIPAR
jgi:hypothetical protein